MLIQQNRLRGSRAAVDADKAADGLTLLERRRRELLPAIGFLESVEFSFFRSQPLGPRLGLFLLPAEVDVVHQFLVALVATDAIVFAFAEFNRAQGSEVLRVVRNLDQILRLRSVGDCNLALPPHAWNVRLPCLAHALDKAIRPTEQKHVRPKRVAAG